MGNFYRTIVLLEFLSVIFICDGLKTCAEIGFCSKYRNYKNPTEQQFEALIEEAKEDQDILTVPLINSVNNSLNLEIGLLKKYKVRIRILETDNRRYQLVDVLEKEPQIVSYDIIKRNYDTLVIAPTGNHQNLVVINRGPAFSVHFYHDKNLEVTLDGSRLVMENFDSQTFTFDVQFHNADILYGLHHHAYAIRLPHTAGTSIEPFRLKNTDTPLQTNSTAATYGAVPALFGHSHKQTSGIFLHNAAEQWVDINYLNKSSPSAHFMVRSGAFDLFVLLGPTPKQVLRQFTDLTGRAHLPHLWTLGYHQSRYSYMSQKEVKDVVKLMDENDFPMEAIWLDIDHTDAKKYFTWNPVNYSDPEEMQIYISSKNKKLVTIVDPHYKVDDSYSVYAGAKGKYFVRWRNGSDFTGECWPGVSSWIDFLDPKARKHYSKLFSYNLYKGSTKTLAGIWNDMNEPSIFNLPDHENTFPEDVVHYGNVLNRDIHNIYGLLQSKHPSQSELSSIEKSLEDQPCCSKSLDKEQENPNDDMTTTKATHQGLLNRDNSSMRPFILSRSHFAGSQRYAAIWTGDNTADWSQLQSSYSECMLSNLVGHVFCGADVGGFSSNPDEELYQRWYQAGVWLPFYRGHSASNTKRREPYRFSKSVQDVVRQAIRTRYKHLRYLYTLFYLHTLSGDPIITPLFYHYPEMINNANDHILIGPDILAVPVMRKGVQEIEVHFPGTTNDYWYRADTKNFTLHKGGTIENISVDISTSPYFYRAGSIILVQNTPRLSTAEMMSDSFTIIINTDAKINAAGVHYGDDGTSLEYAKNPAAYFLMQYEYKNVTFDISRKSGEKSFDFSFDMMVVNKIHEDDVRVETTVYKLSQAVNLSKNGSDKFSINL